MNSGRTILYFFFVTLIFCLRAHADTISTAEYRQQLQQYSARTDQLELHPEQAQEFEREVPDTVSVKGASTEYSISYNWLKNLLKQFEQAAVGARPSILSRIHQQLKTFDDQARGYEQAQAASRESHEKIREILARREFNKAHAPGLLEIWWQKLMRWLSDFFDRHPIYGRKGNDILHIVVYVAVAVAFIFFIMWLKRRLARPYEDLSREIVPFAPSAKGWRTWLAEARDSAQRGGWRDGIHLAYWAGISFLEEQGAWRPDRARTPREYLKMLGSRKPQYPALSALTRKFEVIWYGNRDAGAADFQETLGQLEKLGCR